MKLTFSRKEIIVDPSGKAETVEIYTDKEGKEFIPVKDNTGKIRYMSLDTYRISESETVF